MAVSTDEDRDGDSEMKFPVTVNGIKFQGGDVYRGTLLFGGKCGDFVSVRPCGEKHNKKTYLGVLIGEVALSQGVVHNRETGELSVMRYMHNPMIFIPELNEVVWGCGSWWGKIRSEADLRQITDADIQNVWYVKALKALSETSPTAETADTGV